MGNTVYTQVKYSEYCNLINQNKSLLKENAELKAKLKIAESKSAKETVETVETKVETEPKKEIKKGGNK